MRRLAAKNRGEFGPTATDGTGDHFDKVIEWLLAALSAFMPFAFGAVEAWSEEVVITLAAALSMCFLLKLIFVKGVNIVWSWAYVPAAAFLVVVVLQLTELPAGLIKTISPGTVALKTELLGDLPDSGELLRSMTLSFYCDATKHDLRLAFAIAAVFVVVVNTYRQPNKIKHLLMAIAVVGGLVALLALAQDIFGNGRIYWLVPPRSARAYSGTFVNHSHYGQFMNLSMGAALGLIMATLHEAFAGKKVTPLLVYEYLCSPAARVIWLLVGIVVLGASTVFVSLTRWGMVSMLIAGAFTTLVLASGRSLRGRSWIMALMATGAFVCVLYIGFDAVYDRLATLPGLHQHQGHWQILKDLSISLSRFPVFGTGLGTHEVVYPMFDRSATPALATHAENEYAQAAEETGLVGLGLLVSLAIIVWSNYVRNVRTGCVPIRSATYGLGFGLLAVMIHSLGDSGQHVPANAFLSVVYCSLLLALVRAGQKDDMAAEAGRARRGFRSLRIAALVCASAVWAWALLGADSARVAEAHREESLAVDCQAQNVEYRHWLNVNHWHSTSSMGQQWKTRVCGRCQDAGDKRAGP